jgi:hypothetical protein
MDPDHRRSGSTDPRSGPKDPDHRRSGPTDPDHRRSGPTSPNHRRSGPMYPDHRRSGPTDPDHRRSDTGRRMIKKKKLTSARSSGSDRADPRGDNGYRGDGNRGDNGEVNRAGEDRGGDSNMGDNRREERIDNHLGDSYYFHSQNHENTLNTGDSRGNTNSNNYQSKNIREDVKIFYDRNDENDEDLHR